MDSIKSTNSLNMQLKQYISLNTGDKRVTSSIDFYLPNSSKVNLAIVDNNGKVAKAVANGEYFESGHHSKSIDLYELPAGEYTYQLETEGIKEIKNLKLSKKSVK